jgi:hypothetical protein
MVASAKLQLTPITTSFPGTHAVAFVTNDAWSESTLTWSNKPLSGAALTTWVAAAGVPVLADVTGVAATQQAGDGLLSLRVYGTTTADGLVGYGSKEGAATNAPLLMVNCTNATSLAASQSFYVTVLRPNLPPVLSSVVNTSLIAGAILAVTNSASDPNPPPQRLLFTLLSAPSGASINAISGVVSWRPTMAQSGTSNLFTVVVTQNGWLTNVLPLADASVRDGSYSNQNFGADTVLNVKYFAAMNSGNTRESYLRFPVAAVPGMLASAKLQLLPVSASFAGTHAVAWVTNDAWSESTITWSNRPASGAALATWTPQAGVAVQAEVTAPFQTQAAGDGLLSLRVYGTNQTADGLVGYGSKEGAATNAPLLVISSTNTTSLAATQSFWVTVSAPVQPVMTPAVLPGNFLMLTITGNAGPDYIIQATTNLAASPAWTTLFTTNPAQLPFVWTETNAMTLPARFYRVLLGP